MKLDQLRKIIREEVRAAVKEELQDVMNEAIKIASTPTTAMTETPKPKDSNLKWSAPPKTGRASLDEMLAQTKANMGVDEYKSIGNYDSPKAPNFASGMANKMGLASPEVGVSFADIPGFDPAKAKAVLDASMKIKSKA